MLYTGVWYKNETWFNPVFKQKEQITVEMTFAVYFKDEATANAAITQHVQDRNHDGYYVKVIDDNES